MISYKSSSFLLLSFAASFFLFSSAQYDDGYGGGGMEDMYGQDPYGSMGPETPEPPSRSTVLITQEEVDDFLKADEFFEGAVLGYFETPSHSDDVEVFNEVARQMDGRFRFGYVTDEELIEKSKYKGSAVFIYKPAKLVSEKLEKPRARYPGKTLKAEAFSKFIEDKSLPLVGIKNEKTAPRYEAHSLPELTVFMDVEQKKMFDYFLSRLRKIAVDMVGKMNFNIANKNAFTVDMSSKYGIQSTKPSAAAVGLRKGGDYFAMPAEVEVTQDSVRKFIEDVNAGRVAKMERAVDPSKEEGGEDAENGGDDDEGPSPVVKLTNANFNEVVNESPEKDIMIKFYAPWCGHCKALKPEYEDLADAFAGNENVVIADLDATKHNVPSNFKVEGYPTIYFIKGHAAGTKAKPIVYEGARSASAMENFIRSKGASFNK